jgi:SAM-dependent methyltransferase
MWQAEHFRSAGSGITRFLARRLVPRSTRRWLWEKSKAITCKPPVGLVRFGALRRLTPISRQFGLDRGTPIDRYYIEQFLSAHAADIHGRVLEIGDDTYTRRFGAERVTQSDVLHVESSNPNATIIGDLTDAKEISSDRFDCIILTQTLQFIYEVRAAINTLYRILKPNGVVLMTTSGISQISRYDMDRYGHFWNFTSSSVKRLLEEVFSPRNIQITSQGNVLAAIAFLHGLAAEDLRRMELDYRDPDYELVLTIRAVKSHTNE